MVWGFADITISTNLARDLGTRLVALIFYGREAFTYMGYAPIAILVNIPATLFATAYCKYLFFFNPYGPGSLSFHTTRGPIFEQLYHNLCESSLCAKTKVAYETDELLLRDSFITIGKGHAQHREGDEGLMRHISKTGILKEDDLRQITSNNGDAKLPKIDHMER